MVLDYLISAALYELSAPVLALSTNCSYISIEALKDSLVTVNV